MKQKILTALLVLPLCASAQFFENFDSSTNIPVGWKVISGGAYQTFRIGKEEAYSLSNAALIRTNSTSAQDDYLVTPVFTVIEGVSDRLTYFVKNHDPYNVDEYSVKLTLSEDPMGTDFTTVLLPVTSAPNDWTQVKIDLKSFIGNKIRIGFHSASKSKYQIYFDDIRVDGKPLDKPGSPQLTSPAENVPFDLGDKLEWMPPVTGGVVDRYEVYIGTTTNPDILIPNNYLFAKPKNIQPNTQYFWQVKAINDAGVSVGIPSVKSFKTADSPFMPYCGPLKYTDNGVEPITFVSFNGMTNTTSAETTAPEHEVFKNKIARVNPGGTYSIKLGGNTRGYNAHRFIVFVDWNQDGVFEPSETYFASKDNALVLYNSSGLDGKTVYGDIKVPENAKLGLTRMRIKKNYSSSPYINPCFSLGGLNTGYNGGFGQTEDYSIDVTTDKLNTSEQMLQNALIIYPNPASDVLNISTPEKVLDVRIFAADGKLV
ncbi:Cleaved Adhesin Domain, partial [Cruoricaptor ignavus]